MTTSPPEPSSDEPAKKEAPSLRRRAITGAFVSMAQAFATNGLRLVSNVILTRLLFPEAFGIMALVNTVLMGLNMMSDLGFLPALITNPRAEEPAVRNTMWVIGFARGIVMAIGGALLAFPAAIFYEDDRLLYYLPVASLGPIIMSTRSMNWDLSRRRLDFARIATFEVTAQVLTLIVQALLAWWTRSVWALVVSSLISAVVVSTLSHTMMPGARDRIQWDAEAAREFLGFGRWIFLSTILVFLASRLDVLLLGRLLTFEALGLYSLGMMLAALPREVGNRVIGSILQPTLAEAFRREPARREERVLQVRRPILQFLTFALSGVALLSPAFFEVLYDDRYHDSAMFTQLLVPSVWFELLSGASAQPLLAAGVSRPLATQNAIRLVVTATACLAGHAIYGVTGFVLGISIGTAVSYLVINHALAEQGIRVYAVDIWATLRIGLIVGLGLLVPRAYAWSGGDPTLGLGLPVVDTLVALVILIPFGLVTARNLLRVVRSRPQAAPSPG